MKHILLILLLIFFGNSGFTQDINCEEISTQKIALTSTRNSKFDSLITEDLKVLFHCMELDSSDKLVFNAQSISLFLIREVQSKDSVIYQDLFDFVSDIKASDSYKKSKVFQEFNSKYLNKTVDKNDWTEISSLLTQMGVSDDKQKELRKEVYSKEHRRETYLLAMDSYLNPKKESPQPKIQIELLEFTSLESLIIENQKSKKTTILYFTGWACVNGRKMEECMWEDSKIVKELSNNYNYYMAYADDRKALTEEEKETLKITNLDIKTKGQYNSYIEKQLIGKSIQPIIIRLDSEGKVIDSLGYSLDKKIILDFLKKH